MSQILSKLSNRINSNTIDNNPPLIIFPEGTFTNGYSLMKFKKGAFVTDKPIKIITLSWGLDDSFFASYTNINPLMGIFLFLSQVRNNLIVSEIQEPLDPKFIWKKYGVTNPESDPKAWEYVAREVKQIMALMTGYEETEDGFKEINQFEKDECQKNEIFKIKLFSRECKKFSENIGAKDCLNIGGDYTGSIQTERKAINLALSKRIL